MHPDHQRQRAPGLARGQAQPGGHLATVAGLDLDPLHAPHGPSAQAGHGVAQAHELPAAGVVEQGGAGRAVRTGVHQHMGAVLARHSQAVDAAGQGLVEPCLQSLEAFVHPVRAVGIDQKAPAQQRIARGHRRRVQIEVGTGDDGLGGGRTRCKVPHMQGGFVLAEVAVHIQRVAWVDVHRQHLRLQAVKVAQGLPGGLGCAGAAGFPPEQALAAVAPDTGGTQPVPGVKHPVRGMGGSGLFLPAAGAGVQAMHPVVIGPHLLVQSFGHHHPDLIAVLAGAGAQQACPLWQQAGVVAGAAEAAQRFGQLPETLAIGVHGKQAGIDRHLRAGLEPDGQVEDQPLRIHPAEMPDRLVLERGHHRGGSGGDVEHHQPCRTAFDPQPESDFLAIGRELCAIEGRMGEKFSD